MWTNEKTRHSPDEPASAQRPDSPPERCFTNALILTNLGLFAVYTSVIGPIAEEPKYRIPLPRRQAEDKLKAIADLVETLQKELR